MAHWKSAASREQPQLQITEVSSQVTRVTSHCAGIVSKCCCMSSSHHHSVNQPPTNACSSAPIKLSRRQCMSVPQPPPHITISKYQIGQYHTRKGESSPFRGICSSRLSSAQVFDCCCKSSEHQGGVALCVTGRHWDVALLSHSMRTYLFWLGLNERMLC